MNQISVKELNFFLNSEQKKKNKTRRKNLEGRKIKKRKGKKGEKGKTTNASLARETTAMEDGAVVLELNNSVNNDEIFSKEELNTNLITEDQGGVDIDIECTKSFLEEQGSLVNQESRGRGFAGFEQDMFIEAFSSDEASYLNEPKSNIRSEGAEGFVFLPGHNLDHSVGRANQNVEVMSILNFYKENSDISRLGENFLHQICSGRLLNYGINDDEFLEKTLIKGRIAKNCVKFYPCCLKRVLWLKITIRAIV